jgi:hypothetical protein
LIAVLEGVALLLGALPGRWQSMSHRSNFIQLAIDALLVTGVILSMAAAILSFFNK